MTWAKGSVELRPKTKICLFSQPLDFTKIASSDISMKEFMNFSVFCPILCTVINIGSIKGKESLFPDDEIPDDEI